MTTRQTSGATMILSRILPTVAVTLSATACLTGPDDIDPAPQRIHLTARPATPSQPLPNGRYELELSSNRDGWFYIPPDLDPDAPAPLVVLLHGAGGNARTWDGAIKYADSLGMVLMAPDSRGATWDIVRGTFGPDVDFMDRALDLVFDHVAINPQRIALSGFSDGASYALSLGLGNGDLFTHIIAWSPGFMAPIEQRGRPGIYVSHGTRDGILPINQASRTLVPLLQNEGYDVVYEEFDGIHEITKEVAQGAFEWFLGLETQSVASRRVKR